MYIDLYMKKQIISMHFIKYKRMVKTSLTGLSLLKFRLDTRGFSKSNQSNLTCSKLYIDDKLN